MIPNIAHFFWANRTMSWMRYMTLASFRHFNPEWQMRLHRYVMPSAEQATWNTGERQDYLTGDAARDYWPRVPELGVEVIDWLPPCEVVSPVHASDIFQWQILSTVGGLYCDLDILFTAPLSNAIRCDVDTYVCLYLDAFAIGFLAASPHNPFYADVLQRAIANQSAAYQSAGCEAAISTIQSYPTFTTVSARRLSLTGWEKSRIHAIKTQHIGNRVLNMRRETVYPFWWDCVAEIFLSRRISLPDSTVGIHWYAGSPLSQEFNRRVDSANFREFSNTFSHFAAMVKP